MNHFGVHFDRTLVDIGLVTLSDAQAIQFLQIRELLKNDWPVAGFRRCWVALEAKFLQSCAILNNVVKLAQIFDPVMPQVKIHKFLLIRQILNLTHEVVIEVQLSQLFVLLETLNLLNLVEGKNQDEQVWQALHMLNLLDLVVEEVEVNDALDLMLSADSSYQVLGDVIKLASHRNLRRHRILNGSSACVLIEFVVVVHKLTNMRIDHKVMQRSFQTSHVASV